MKIDPAELSVKDNAAEQRYEIAVGDQLAILTYRLSGDRITLIHTGVPKALEGQGVAARLTRFVLDDARARHLAVVPRCPYVVRYLQRHRELADLVVTEERAQFLGSESDR